MFRPDGRYVRAGIVLEGAFLQDGISIDCGHEARARRVAGHLTFLAYMKSRDIDGLIPLEALTIAEQRLRPDFARVKGKRSLRDALLQLTRSYDWVARVCA